MPNQPVMQKHLNGGASGFDPNEVEKVLVPEVDRIERDFIATEQMERVLNAAEFKVSKKGNLSRSIWNRRASQRTISCSEQPSSIGRVLSQDSQILPKDGDIATSF